MESDVAVDYSTSAHGRTTFDRKVAFASGEEKLREYLPKNAPLKLTLAFQHERRRWEVLTQFTPEGNQPIFLGCEALEEFPSPTLIAQAMLLS
jgi:hypothetical protein